MHGVGDADVADASPLDRVWPQVSDLVGGRLLVVHHAGRILRMLAGRRPRLEQADWTARATAAPFAHLVARRPRVPFAVLADWCRGGAGWPAPPRQLARSAARTDSDRPAQPGPRRVPVRPMRTGSRCQPA